MLLKYSASFSRDKGGAEAPGIFAIRDGTASTYWDHVHSMNLKWKVCPLL